MRTSERYVFAATLGVGSALWSVHALAKLPWYAGGDPAWLLDVARHVASGNGVTTSVTLPAYLVVSGDAPVDSNPQLQTPPAYPAMLGLAFKAFGGSEATAMALQAVLFVGLLALTYLVARSLLPPIWAALATVVLAFDPALLAHATLGAEHNLLFAVGVMATSALLVRAPPRLAPFAGVALGLLQLVRFNAGGLLPAFLLLAHLTADQTEGVRRPLRFLAGWVIALAVALLLTRGLGAMSTSGTISLLFGTAAYPGLTIQGVLSIPTPSEVLERHVAAVAAKGAAGLRYYVSGFATAGNPAIAGGVILAILLLLRLREARPLLWFVVVATVTTVSIMSFFDFAVAHLAFLLPLYTLLVVTAARHFGVGLPVLSATLIVLGLLQYSAETARAFRDAPSRAVYAQEVARLSQAVGRFAGPGDWIATDLPSALTWHTGVPSVRLPNRPEDLEAVERLRRPLTLVVVTNVEVSPTSQRFLPGAWEPVLERGALPGFVLAERFDGERIRAVILRRSR